MIGMATRLALMAGGLALIMIFFVFVCTRLVCARIMQRAASRRQVSTTARLRSDLGLLECGLHGLEPVVVATCPTKRFNEMLFPTGEDAQCAICLADYEEKDILRILPYCSHSFHITCIDTWLWKHCTCPVCRVLLRGPPIRKQIMPPMFSLPVQPSPHGAGTFSSHWHSPQTVDAPQMEPILEDQFQPQLDAMEAGEVNSMLSMDRNYPPKTTSDHSSESKHVESPSNP